MMNLVKEKIMLPPKIKCWKKDGSRWISYSRVFILNDTTPASYQMMAIARMVKRGWIAYSNDFKRVTDKTPRVDYDFAVIDISPYECKLEELDPDSYKAGKAFSKFAHDYLNRPRAKKKVEDEEIQPPASITPLDSKELDMVLTKAVADYKANKYVPPMLLRKVITYLGNK